MGIIQNALEQSVQDSLAELQARLERQYEDQARGKDMALAIRTTNDQIDSLTRALRERRDALARRRVTSIETPHVVAVAAVVPGPVPHVVETGLGGDMTAVELAAMRVVEGYERRHGRTVTDSHKQGVGYDFKSEGPNGEVRYIEVKGHTTTGDVILYYTEWQTANRMREEFFIYLIENALSDPKLLIVQDPVGKGIQPVERVVEYQIGREQLVGVAEEA